MSSAATCARALVGPIAQVRKILKKFPNIADPGADRILLFAGLAPVAAVPSNCPHVLVRIQRGQERENYGVTYREAQQAIETEIPQTFDSLVRAYLLLKRHGQELCKRTKPKCERVPCQHILRLLRRKPARAIEPTIVHEGDFSSRIEVLLTIRGCRLRELRERMVGASGFEPPASWSRTRRASQAALRPESCYRLPKSLSRIGTNRNLPALLHLFSNIPASI